MRRWFGQRPILALVPHKKLVVAIHPHCNNNPASKRPCSIGLRDVDMMGTNRFAYGARACPVFGESLERIVRMTLRMLLPVLVVCINRKRLAIVLGLECAEEVAYLMLGRKVRKEPPMSQQKTTPPRHDQQQNKNPKSNQQ